MLHMLRSMLGDKAFFSAITSYFTKNAYSSAVSRDLWKHLEQPARERGVLDGDSTIQSIMETWVNNSGSGLSVLYRDISRKQYIASFGNIRKYRDIRRYRDIVTIFFMHDIGQFWPLIDL